MFLINLVEDDQLDFEYEVNDHVEMGYVQIHCKVFDLEFFIGMLGDGPFYEDLLFTLPTSAHISTQRSCAPNSITDISSHRRCHRRSSQMMATTKTTAK
ncbi:hypothetical protein EMGBS4_18890 [Acidimicrobiaceae bacterium]|nr:hypothetical protein EMGBS4_18890 [Acidimicrobiaceae bacterium]